MLIKKNLRLSVFLFLLISSGAIAQNIPDNPLLRDYMKQRGISEKDAKAIVGKSRDRKTADADSVVLAENQKVKPDSVRVPVDDTIRSFYEEMLANRIVNPDSMIKSLRVFGHDLFQHLPPATFTPSSALAAPANYTIGSGDELVIVLWGRMNEEYKLTVDRQGQVNVPHLGPLGVAGLTFAALQKIIQDRVQAIEGVQASITLGELRSLGVYIVGEVKSPGLYTLSSLSNVTNALFAAGGPTKLGSLRNIQLKRNGSLISTIDFYDFFLSGKDNTGMQLRSGDVVVVPMVKRMAAIAGNVRKSALYEIEESTTLKELIGLAGGLTPTAWTNRIQIERYQDNQYQTVLDLASAQSQNIPDFKVRDGDVVKVFSVVIKDKNAVRLSGNVLRPGKFEFRQGMKVTDLLPDYQALMPETYLDYALIMRREPPAFRDRIIPFNLKNVLDNPASTDNLPLADQDEIIVYPRDYFEPDRIVYIDGAVNVPGKQILFENMKVRDLIVKAGGLTDEASMERGELYRRSYVNEKVAVEKTEFNVADALADIPSANLILKRFDRLYIRKKMGWEEEIRVTLRGEFLYPGEYVVLRNEPLDQLIKRAGGFSANAYLPAAVLTRASVKTLEGKRLDEYTRRLETDAIQLATQLAAKGQSTAEAQALLAQQQTMLEKQKGMETVGRVVIDLTKPVSYSGFNLENGDELYVPREMGTVSVIGEVFNPATFRYSGAGLMAHDYIEMAGGFKESADQKHVYVIKVNGGIETNKGSALLNRSLNPGDVIVVPTQIQYKNNFKSFVDGVDATFKIVATLVSLVTLIVLVNGLK